LIFLTVRALDCACPVKIFSNGSGPKVAAESGKGRKTERKGTHKTTIDRQKAF
jgi:hypothetical protein